MSGIISKLFSETRDVEQRRLAGLHPINELQRFRLFLACLFCSICISMIYIFDIFTKDFSERFHLSAGDLATISTVGMCVCWFVLPYGFVFNYIGPMPLLALGMLTSFIGCLCLALTFRGYIHGSLATVCVFYTLMSSASGLIDSATIVTIAEVFPRNRGPMIGLAKVMTGLGSSMWASISLNLFRGDIPSFVFFFMVLVPCVCTVSMFVVRLPPYFVNPWRRRGKTPEEIERLQSLKLVYDRKNVPIRRLVLGFGIACAMIAYFAISTPVKAYTGVSFGGQIFLGVFTIVLFLCFVLIALPIRWLGGVDEPAPRMTTEATQLLPLAERTAGGAYELDDPRADGEQVDAAKAAAYAPLSGVAELAPELDVETAVQTHKVTAELLGPSRQDPRYGGTLWHNLKQPDIWLLLLAFVCQSALGNMVTYNSSTISVALNGYKRSSELSALYTAFLGVGSAVGRIAMGLFEAYVQHQDPNHRRFLVTMALPVPPLLATIAGVLMLVLPGPVVLLPYIIVYFEEGFFNAVRAIIYPCLYEGDHPVYYNMSFMSSIVSIVVFNRVLFGYSVDAEHRKMGFGRDQDCNRRRCVQTPLIVGTCTAAFAILLMVTVHIRYSRFVHRARASMREAELMPVVDKTPQADGGSVEAGEDAAEAPPPVTDEDHHAAELKQTNHSE